MVFALSLFLWGDSIAQTPKPVKKAVSSPEEKYFKEADKNKDAVVNYNEAIIILRDFKKMDVNVGRPNYLNDQNGTGFGRFLLSERI